MKKKVLHTVNIAFVLPYFIGEQFTYFKSKGLQQHIACSPSDFLTDYAQRVKIPFLEVNIVRNISIIADIKAILKIGKYIRVTKSDIVIGHTPKGALLGMIAAWLFGVKHRVYFRHGLMFETSVGMKKKMLITIEKITGMLATKVVCVSPSVLHKSNQLKLSHPSKNIILNKGTCNGIDSQRFIPQNRRDKEVRALQQTLGINPEDKVIGFVGRLVNDKGIDELVNAWQLLIQKYKNIKLLLIGPYEERDAISEKIRHYITETPSIISTGLITDVVPFYALMDIFILPSYREGFPTVVLEASAMELPIITSTATGCIDSIIEDQTGIFTEIAPHSISEKISYYLDNPEVAKLHGKNGRNFVLANFDQSVIWKEIEDKILSY